MKKHIAAIFTLLAVLPFTPQVEAQQPERPLPEFKAFVTEVKSRLQFNQTQLKQYTYQQRNTQKRLDKSGRVEKVETRLYEVFPDADQKLAYRRLVEKNGEPVSESELRKQDREYDKRRADREKKRLKSKAEDEEKARQEEKEAIDEAFRVFDMAMEGRETIDGRPTIRFSFKPKPGVKATSSEVKILRNFAGRVWFDESLYELVRLELDAVNDVSIGFGLVAKLRKGAKAFFERRLFNDEVWLPSTARFTGNLRLLLFKGMRMDVSDEFFDYRRFSVETSVSFDKR